MGFVASPSQGASSCWPRAGKLVGSMRAACGVRGYGPSFTDRVVRSGSPPRRPSADGRQRSPLLSGFPPVDIPALVFGYRGPRLSTTKTLRDNARLLLALVPRREGRRRWRRRCAASALDAVGSDLKPLVLRAAGRLGILADRLRPHRHHRLVPPGRAPRRRSDARTGRGRPTRFSWDIRSRGPGLCPPGARHLGPPPSGRPSRDGTRGSSPRRSLSARGSRSLPGVTARTQSVFEPGGNQAASKRRWSIVHLPLRGRRYRVCRGAL